MSGAKLDLARRAVETAVGRLLPMDRFAIVVYDDRIDVVVESTPASREAKTMAVDRLRTIDARGSTNLGERLAARRRAGRGRPGRAAPVRRASVNRVLLLTDGLANQGITDPAELTRHAAELRARGVTTTTFGVGEDFDEALLQVDGRRRRRPLLLHRERGPDHATTSRARSASCSRSSPAT